MKKNLLGTFLLVFISVAAFGQAYTYHVYQATPLNGTAYSLPDVAITGMGVFTPEEEASTNTQNIGLDARYFDQVDGLGVASVYDNDIDKTCGLNPDAGVETGAALTQIRGWALNSDVDGTKAPFCWNNNPASFRKGGGWYMYTVNFTEAKDYALFMRVRGTPPNATNQRYTVTIYNKSDMATEVGKWDFSLEGMAIGTEGSESTDGKMKFLAYAKRDASGTFIAGQAASCWINSIEKVNISAAGEYVVKVSHNSPGASNTAFGAFTFAPDFATNISSAKASIANVTFANNTLMASFGELVNGTMKIYNLSGSVVFEKAIASSSVSENINLVKGVYLVSVETNAGSVVEKIIVK